MIIYQYKPGWRVSFKDYWLDQGDKCLARVTIVYTVDNADNAALPPIVGRHDFEYFWVTPDLTRVAELIVPNNELPRLFDIRKLRHNYLWNPDPAWQDSRLGNPVLSTPRDVVYDAVTRFELHEVRHFLRTADGEHIINPHPGAVDGTTPHPSPIHPDEPRL